MFNPAVVRLILVLLALLAGSSVPRAAAQIAPTERGSWPTGGWQLAAPEEQGMDPALLAELDARLPAELPLLSGLVVIRGGEIVFERYYGQTADEPIDLWSATKSVTSMAVG